MRKFGYGVAALFLACGEPGEKSNVTTTALTTSVTGKGTAVEPKAEVTPDGTSIVGDGTEKSYDIDEDAWAVLGPTLLAVQASAEFADIVTIQASTVLPNADAVTKFTLLDGKKGCAVSYAKSNGEAEEDCTTNLVDGLKLLPMPEEAKVTVKLLDVGSISFGGSIVTPVTTAARSLVWGQTGVIEKYTVAAGKKVDTTASVAVVGKTNVAPPVGSTRPNLKITTLLGFDLDESGTLSADEVGSIDGALGADIDLSTAVSSTLLTELTTKLQAKDVNYALVVVVRAAEGTTLGASVVKGLEVTSSFDVTLNASLVSK